MRVIGQLDASDISNYPVLLRHGRYRAYRRAAWIVCANHELAGPDASGSGPFGGVDAELIIVPITSCHSDNTT